VAIIAGLCAMAAFTPSAALAAGSPSNSHGSSPNAIYKAQDSILTPDQQAAVQQKNARYSQWLATQGQGQGLSRAGAVSPFCIVGDNGRCFTTYEVSGGGEWYQEPYDEPNWCAPGAAANVYLHWNYNAVANHSSVSVPRDYHTGGGTATYLGAQGWMAWFAVNVGFSDRHGVWRTGVMDTPYYNGADEVNVANALDTLTSNYYHVVNTTSVSDLVGKTKYDITVDGRPLDYFANAQFLPNWHNVGGQLNHSIEVYGMTQSVGGADYSSDYIEYADSISASDSRASAGDHSDFQSHMYTQVLKTSAASGDITW
jgi:hypothetical protein